MKLKQGSQCTYNVTLRCVRATTLQSKNSKYYTFRQCAFAALGIQRGMRMRRICHLWPFGLCYIFPHYRLNGTISEKKKATNIKRVFCFSLQLVSETFLILKITKRIWQKKIYWSSCKVPVILVRFWRNLKFSRQIFEKYANIKFYENPSSGSRVVGCGRTKMIIPIVVFRNFVTALTNHVIYMYNSNITLFSSSFIHIRIYIYN
jgi:hypothetical protein